MSDTRDRNHERGRFLRPKLKRQLDRLSFARRKPYSSHAPGASETDASATLLAQGLDPIRSLEELIAIDSVTDNRKGVNLVQKILATRLERMGFTLAWISNPRGWETSGDLLVATLAPNAPKSENQYINFVSHADTVLGLEQVGPLRTLEDGRTGRGAGVIDNKGGLVVALTGLELFLNSISERRQRRFGLRFISSPNEEAGSVGFNDLFRDYARDSVMALGFEPALDDGSIISSRRGNRWYHVKVQGVEAHAGRSRGEHVNAAHELAIKIARLHKLNAPKMDLAVNVGHISGGRDKFNVVCGFAEAKIDTRFSTFQSRDQLHRQIEKILHSHSVFNIDRTRGPQVSVEIADDCPPFASTSRSRAMVRDYARIISEIEDRDIGTEKAGGAGDVNYMSDRSVVVIDGLGPVGGRMHTTEEFIHLPSLSTRALALSRFLDQVESRF